MIKLRCLAVTDKSTFFVGDVCNVTWSIFALCGKRGKVEFSNKDNKKLCSFILEQNELYADFSWWRVLLVPNTEAA